MTCDDFIAALKREDFTSENLMNIARWAKKEEARLSKKGIVGARTGDTLLLNEDGCTVRVTLEKVNRTKTAVVLQEDFKGWSAGDPLNCFTAMLTREVAS
jgi:hypothetical protein